MQRVKALVSTAPFMMLARLSGAGAGFLAQLVLARLLPPHALGKFFAATSLAAVLGIIATQGYPGVIQRFVTRYRRPGRTAHLAAFVAQIHRETTIAALVLTTLLAVPAVLLPSLETDWRIFLFATAVCVAAASSFSIYPPLACADRKFALGLLPETLARPSHFFRALRLAVALSGITLTAGHRGCLPLPPCRAAWRWRSFSRSAVEFPFARGTRDQSGAVADGGRRQAVAHRAAFHDHVRRRRHFAHVAVPRRGERSRPSASRSKSPC